MISAGIDAGFRNVKAVLVNEGQLLSYVVYPAGKESISVAAESAILGAIEQAGVHRKDIQYIAATGGGKGYIPFVEEQLPEALCLAKGIDRLLPSTRTLLDLGAHKSLAMRCHQGTVARTAINGKCASGTATYLEMAAKLLGMGMEEIATFSPKPMESLGIQSTCTVFAESEIISLIHMKKKPEDILAGVFKSLAERLYPLLVEVNFDRDVMIVGGIARSMGVVKAIEELVGYPVLVPDNPDIVGALGAALLAGRTRGLP